MSKKCVKCGFELRDSDMYCCECGAPQPRPDKDTQISKMSAAYPDCEISQPDEETICITVKGVTFNMKLVKGGMMDKYTELTDFYIGETTVTQELWQMLMGNNPSADIRNMQLPVTNLNTPLCTAFFLRLEKMTGCHFDFPTIYQWIYAHNGGTKTRNTKYAGSDNIDEVAWTKDNSKKKTQCVGMLRPNELGLYDMDGNVQEYCRGKLSETKKHRLNPDIVSNVSLAGFSVSNKENVDFAGIRLAVLVPVSSTILGFKKCKDSDALLSACNISQESPLYDIVRNQQRLQETRFAKEIEEKERIAREKEALKKAEEERKAREAAEKEAKKKAEAERKAREAAEKEAQRKAEKERKAREAAEKKALEESTMYSVFIDNITDNFQAMMTARAIFGWGSADFRKNTSSLPLKVSSIKGKTNANVLANKLRNGGFTSNIKTE